MNNEEVIKKLEELCEYKGYNYTVITDKDVEALHKAIEALKNEPKKGEWIRQAESKTIFFCSRCGREINTSPFTRTDNFPFCHCGADMREETNDK